MQHNIKLYSLKDKIEKKYFTQNFIIYYYNYTKFTELTYGLFWYL